MSKPEYVVVPVEPDSAMRLASKRYKSSTKITTGPGFYKAMLSAAPSHNLAIIDKDRLDEILDVYRCVTDWRDRNYGGYEKSQMMLGHLWKAVDKVDDDYIAALIKEPL